MNLGQAAQATALRSPSARRVTTIILNVTVGGLWLWLFRPIYDNLAIIFTREDFRLNQIALAGVIALMILRFRRDKSWPRLDTSPTLYAPALVMALTCAALFVLVERFLDINTVAMALFGLATYGLLGLWMAPRAWREGLPAAVLLVGTLPFGDYIDVFIGYPMRIATAGLVRDGLAAAGIGSVGIDTILVFENGISQVDLPCSGVKSLWTGMLFYIAATWVERRRFNLRWVLAALIFVGLLFAANLARVATLITVGEVLGQRLIAELLHVPLGVLGFAVACAAVVLLLRWFQRFGSLSVQSVSSVASVDASPLHQAPATPWVQPVLLIALLALNVLNSPRPSLASTAAAVAQPTWSLPTELNATTVQLRPGELDWLIRDGADSVERLRFDWRGITGSMLLVPSRNWRAHHHPERCFENYGLLVENAQTVLIDAEATGQPLPVRSLTLTNGKPGGQLSATYWFQSPTRASDDYGTRLWAAFSLKPEPWVLVSILFDARRDPNSVEVAALHLALRDSVQAHLSRWQEDMP